jgi:tellurite resistance protein TerC
VKLILHALHENNVPFINGGEPIDVVEISTGLSLSVIVGVLLITVVASLLSPRGRAQHSVSSLRHLAHNYLDIDYEEDESVRAASYQRLVDEEMRVKALPEKYRRYIREEQKLLDLVARAHAVHDERVRTAG